MFKVSARTVLELGSELISTDIIAFYELAKNAFDARTKNGVEIRFAVVLRRNAYLRLRGRAAALWRAPNEERAAFAARVDRERAAIVRDLKDALDPAAGQAAVAAFTQIVAAAADGDAKVAARHPLDWDGPAASLVSALDRAYRELNTITVSDTGTGMSRDDLERHYLVIGTPSRKRDVDAAIASGAELTPFLGEKGIGRLSAMRLGSRLLVETARATDPTLNLLEIDWRAFETLDAMIEDVPVAPVVGGPKATPTWSGTALTISDLSADWTEAGVTDLAKYDFARLTDPFADDTARPRIALHWNGRRISIPSLDRTFLAHANARVTGALTIEGGEPVLRSTATAINLGYKHPPGEVDVMVLSRADLEGTVGGGNESVPYDAVSSLGPFTFEIHWFNRRLLAEIAGVGNQAAVRELQRRWAGILLFRDGFRIFPYGDEDDDWLALDRRALGRTGYALNKAQFVGRVTISRTANPALVDQTNREGLREGPEQQALLSLLSNVIQNHLWGFLKEMDRRYRREPLELGAVKQDVSSLAARAKSALGQIRKLVPRGDAGPVDDLQQAFFELQDLAARVQQRVAEVEQDSRQMVQMAGVGLMVEVVAHELARSSEMALQALEALKGKEVPGNLRAHLDTLRAEMRSVSKRLRILDPLSVSGRQRAEAFDLASLVDDLVEAHAAQFGRHGVTCEVRRPESPIRLHVVKGMVVQILENLIANSIYWMDARRMRDSTYRPIITFMLESNPPTIRVTDNGPGIAPENRDKIFRPFWSLKERAKRRGLGLFIARECAHELGGKLTLAERPDPATGRYSEFVLELPDGTVKR